MNMASLRAALGYVVVAIAVIALVLWWPTLNGSESARAHAETRHVNYFGMALEAYFQEYGKMPGPALSDATKALMEYHKRDPEHTLKINWQPYLQNRTVWGGPFIYEWLDGGRHVKFRSTGQNQKDDHGGGDDLQFEMDESASITRGATTTSSVRTVPGKQKGSGVAPPLVRP